MNILEALVQLRDDLKAWVTNNLNAINTKIEEKTIPVDSELSSTSTNPVQNKVINAELESLNTLVGDTPVATQISTAIASQDLFSGDYNDLTNAPNISEDGSDNVVIADEDGNIIFKVDADGTHTTNVEINGTSIGAKIPVWDAKSDFSGDYNDLENAPDILEDGVGNLIVADEDGNIILQADAAGVHTTTLDAKNVTINNQSVTDIMDIKIADLVNSAPETLDTLGELATAMETNSDAIEALEVIATSKASKSDLEATNTDVAALQGLVGDKSVSEQISTHAENTNLHVSAEEKSNWNNKSDFSGDYNDLSNAPSIEENNDGDMIVADENGNIIFKVDENGIHSTALTLNGVDIIETIGAHTGDTNAHITEEERDTWNNKVDKETGKGLSTNDFTTAEKTKLAGIADGANKTVVDTGLSSTSTNPVQNKIITTAINELDALVGDEPVADQISNAISEVNKTINSHTGNTEVHVTAEERITWNNKSDFSGDYNDLTNAPNIYEDSSNELVIADPDGNIIFRSDGAGFETTTLTTQTVKVGGSEITGVDSSLSTESTNPVQNKVLAEAIGAIKYPVTSVNSKTGDVVLTAADVGALPNTTDIPSIDGLATQEYVDTQFDNFVGDDPVSEQIEIAITAAKVDASNKDAVILAEAQRGINVHADNGDIHVTADQKAVWDAKSDFSGNYNDLIDAPDITEDGEGNMVITDDNGNIIFQVDETGVQTTALTLDGEDVIEKITGHTNDSMVHITADERNAWNNKVDREDGKMLSSNDYTNEEKEKLAELGGLIGDTSVSEQINTAIENFKLDEENTYDIVGLDTLIWDGNTDGLVKVGNLYHISDMVPTPEELANGVNIGFVDQNGVWREFKSVEPGTATESGYYTYSAGYINGETCGFTIIPTDNFKYILTYPKAGIWARNMGSISSFTINNYTGFGTKKINKLKLYYPDWEQNDASSLSYIKNRTHYESETGSGTVTWDGNTNGIVRTSNMYKVAEFKQHYFAGDPCTITYYENGQMISKETTIDDDMLYEVYPLNYCYADSDRRVWLISDNAFSGNTYQEQNDAWLAENQITETGVYFLKTSEADRVISINIPSITDYPVLKKLDAKFLPIGDGLKVDNGIVSVDVVDNLVSDSTTQALSAAQGKALNEAINSITTDLGNLGGGDMLKATYDKNGDGIVDNAAQLEGHAASYFATAEAFAALDTLVGDTKVSEQINKAIANKSDMGHTHTASDVGAAPAGYGLGEIIWVQGRSANDIVDNGWYSWAQNEMTEAPFEMGYMLVISRQGTKYVTQIAFTAYYTGVGVTQAKIRTLGTDGKWGEWVRCDPGAFAPAGYGLGTGATFITDLNTATETGFYYWNATGVNAPFTVANGGGSMFVIKRNDNYIIQYAFDNTKDNSIAIRAKRDGSWKNWYDISPSIQYSLGVTLNGALPSGANLNTYTTPGQWSCATSAVANSLINSSGLGAGKLTVEYSQGADAYYITQTWHSFDGYEATRSGTNDNGVSWTAWRRKITSDGGSMSGSLNMNNNIIWNLARPVAGDQAANKQYVDDAAAQKLHKAGDSMEGALNMNGHEIWGLSNPTGYDQPVTYRMHVDDLAGKLPTSGGTMTGSIRMDGNSGEKLIRFNNTSGTYKHDTNLYGGDPSSRTGIGCWDSGIAQRVWSYDDQSYGLILGGSSASGKYTKFVLGGASAMYGTTLPAAGTAGRIFFKKV